MKQIPLTQGKFALVDDEDFERLSGLKWHVRKSGNCFYATTYICKVNGKSTYFFMHRLILNPPDGIGIDHIDRNSLNNQKSNLRFATDSQNQANRRMQRNNKSGVRGVHKHNNKWRARIYFRNKQICLGEYNNLNEAAKVYDEAAKRYFGEFAYSNN